MRVYIAGPITGVAKISGLDSVQTSFALTADELRSKGFEPVSPFELHDKHKSWEESLKADIAGLVTCGGIYYKKGWRESTGVKLERYIAKALGFVEFYEDPTEGNAHGGSQRFHQILEELGQLHDKKQRDYGSGNDPFANVRGSVAFGVPAWVGA